MDAAAFRAIACSFYFPDFKWIRSFWERDAGVIHCVYEARSSADIFEHAQTARIPCNEVREVQSVRPGDYTGNEVRELAQT